MSAPQRLNPDPSVALVGYRFQAESPGPQEHHDVALMLGNVPEECEECGAGFIRYPHHFPTVHGSRVVCQRCRLVLRWWSCDCADATFRERPCKHISQAMALYAAERRADRGGA